MTTDVTSCAKKSRGRPKVFDRDAALDKAMTLFWQHGYEATSLSDLVEATGAKAPTLYAEFTNKEGLFRAVADGEAQAAVGARLANHIQKKGTENIRPEILAAMGLDKKSEAAE